MIIRNVSVDGNLAPKAINFLAEIPENVLHHEHHGLRHPFSIYHVSLRRVAEALTAVFARYNHEIGHYEKHGDVDRYKELLRAQRDLAV